MIDQLRWVGLMLCRKVVQSPIFAGEEKPGGNDNMHETQGVG